MSHAQRIIEKIRNVFFRRMKKQCGILVNPIYPDLSPYISFLQIFICFSFVFSIFYEVKFKVCLTNYFTLRTVTILSGIFYYKISDFERQAVTVFKRAIF